jgi:hypothetical protein
MHNFRVASRKPEEMKEALGALNSDIIRRMTEGGVEKVAEPTFKAKMAALVREAIADTFALEDMTPIFCSRKSANLGDKVEITRKHNTLRVVKYAPGAQPLMFSPVKSKYTVSTSMFELPFGIELFKILTRQYELADLTAMAGQAMIRHNIELVLTAINTACGVGATDVRGRALRTTAAGADVAKAELDAALRRLGPGVSIFGSRYALDPIFSFGGGLSENLKDELNTRGLIGVYRGAKLVSVEDDYNEYAASWTKIGGVDREKLIFIASPDKGAVKIERDLSQLNWSEVSEEKAIFRSSERLDHGIFVDKPFRYHVIQTV